MMAKISTVPPKTWLMAGTLLLTLTWILWLCAGVTYWASFPGGNLGLVVASGWGNKDAFLTNFNDQYPAMQAGAAFLLMAFIVQILLWASACWQLVSGKAIVNPRLMVLFTAVSLGLGFIGTIIGGASIQKTMRLYENFWVWSSGGLGCGVTAILFTALLELPVLTMAAGGPSKLMGGVVVGGGPKQGEFVPTVPGATAQAIPAHAPAPGLTERQPAAAVVAAVPATTA